MDLEDLPKDLVTVEIARKLSHRSLERLGLASKGWNAWLKSLLLPSLAPWCVVMQKFELDRNNVWHCPNRDLNRFVFHGLDVFYGGFGMTRSLIPAVFDLDENTWHEWDLAQDIVASCKNYLLFQNEGDFVLRNPHRSSYQRRVPNLSWRSDYTIDHLSMTLLMEDTEEVTHNPNFKIVKQYPRIRLSREDRKLNFAVFDSKKNSWDDSPKFKPVFTLRVGLDVCVYDSLYQRDTCVHDNKYMIYRVQTSEECEEGRNQISVPHFPGSIQEYPRSSTIYLLEHEGMPMIFGRVWNDTYGKRCSDIIIWRMDIEANCFVEVMRVPNKALVKFYPNFDLGNSPREHINFRTHGDYLYLLDYISSQKMLICNLKEKLYYIKNFAETISKTQKYMHFHLMDLSLEMPLEDITAYKKNPSTIFPSLSSLIKE